MSVEWKVCVNIVLSTEGYTFCLFFFLQIGDPDEPENNTPDEEAEELNRNKKSPVENSGTDEQQVVCSCQPIALSHGSLSLQSRF